MAETLRFDTDALGAVPQGWMAGMTAAVRIAGPWRPMSPHGRSPTFSSTAAGAIFRGAWSAARCRRTGRFRSASSRSQGICIELDDAHITGPGAVGPWAKAHSVTLFDDFSFEARR